MDIKRKVILQTKGEIAALPVRQLRVALRWTAPVDLDLMAFYRAKDGREGGVFSDNFPDGTLGSLNQFPYIALSGDAGVGAQEGDNEEVLHIAKLDEMAEVFICALNYTDAINHAPSAFSTYDGRVWVSTDNDQAFEIPLNATEKGVVAVIAKINNADGHGPILINENTIMTLPKFVSAIPGAKAIVQ